VSALEELRTVYRDRRVAGPTVGYVGADVPRELIEAAGCTALRLAPLQDVETAQADRILGPGVEESVRRVFAGLLEGAYPIERVVLCHDSDHSVRLYAALRRLAPPIEILFLDLLHLPRSSSRAYSRARLADLAQALGGRDAEEAIATANRARALGPRLAELRRDGALSGADALAVLGAGTALPAARYADLLETALGELAPNGAPRRSVLLLGSEHPDERVYAALDALDATVVGETHSWGEALLAGGVDEAAEPLDALAHYYCTRPRVLPAPADLQLAWIAGGDQTVQWTLPHERRRLGHEIRVARTFDELREAVA
jgi:benzoyl-CoA reductase/2-hydroxyglutaryl-CoA dehydratase subunit BcrC/BadD/HgdB